MSYEEERKTDINQQKKCQMNNNIESIDLEEELYEHFKFEVPKGCCPCELINT
jgi:hypothetical protein